MVHLRLCMYAQMDAGDKRHPQRVMLDMGITYRYAVPQSIADQWWFLDCQNVPDELPKFITTMDNFDPHKAVGYGLSKEMADTLAPVAKQEQSK